MTHTHRHLDPESLTQAERYKLLTGCIVPRPIAFVSTVDASGRTNLAPFSFANAVGSEPMLVMFCPANGPNGEAKDTLRNAAPPSEGGTGEFVLNLAVESYAEEVAIAAEPLPFGESEFDLTGLAPAPSVRVAAPRVAASPAAFECVTEQIIRTRPGHPGGGNIVIGRVVAIHLREGLVNDRMHVDPDALAAIGRMSGRSYCRTRDRFELERGRTT